MLLYFRWLIRFKRCSGFSLTTAYFTSPHYYPHILLFFIVDPPPCKPMDGCPLNCKEYVRDEASGCELCQCSKSICTN